MAWQPGDVHPDDEGLWPPLPGERDEAGELTEPTELVGWWPADKKEDAA